MNRKGSIIAIIITPLIAFAFILASLVAMLGFDEDVSLQRAELRALDSMSEAGHKLIKSNILKIVGSSITDSTDSADFIVKFDSYLKDYASEYRSSDLNTNIYAKISLGEYIFEAQEDNYVIYIDGVFEKYSSGNNDLSRSYSLIVKFDENKVISIDEIVEQDL